MAYSLAGMVRRTRNPRRSVIPIRRVIIPATAASNLYATAYRPIVELWAAAIDPIMAEYERTLPEMTQDSPADVSAVVSRVEANATAVILTVGARLEEWARRVEALHRRKWRAAIQAATQLDIGMMIGPADVRTTLGAVIEQNVALVKSVSDQTRQRIAQEVFDGLRTNKAPREVAKALGEKVAMGRRRALNIASDQSSTLAAQLDAERRRQAGIESWRWVSSGKINYRPEHKARNGKLYSEASDLVGRNYDGQRILKEPPADDRPGVPIHCGCTSAAVLVLD